MKTTQVVSGFLLGSVLLVPAQFLTAQTVFNDGGVHIINDASLRDQMVEVSGGTTLRLEAGAQIGGAFNEIGAINVYDTSTLILAGGEIGVGGGSSGSIMLLGGSRFVVESGVLGGDAPSSGQVMAMEQSGVIVQGGQVGGLGAQSGLIGLFQNAVAEIRGGQFGGGGEFSGLLLSFDAAQCLVFACESELPFGPVVAPAGTVVLINALTKTGDELIVPVMSDGNGLIGLVEDCDGEEPVDTDGDGVLDPNDACLESDLRPTVWILNIDTRIPNQINGQPVNAEGCSLNDLVNAMVEEASENARNRWEFLWLVGQGLREMKKEGLLPNRWLGHLQNCANHARWDDAMKRKHHQRRLNWRRNR